MSRDLPYCLPLHHLCDFNGETCQVEQIFTSFKEMLDYLWSFEQWRALVCERRGGNRGGWDVREINDGEVELPPKTSANKRGKGNKTNTSSLSDVDVMTDADKPVIWHQGSGSAMQKGMFQTHRQPLISPSTTTVCTRVQHSLTAHVCLVIRVLSLGPLVINFKVVS